MVTETNHIVFNKQIIFYILLFVVMVFCSLFLYLSPGIELQRIPFAAAFPRVVSLGAIIMSLFLYNSKMSNEFLADTLMGVFALSISMELALVLRYIPAYTNDLSMQQSLVSYYYTHWSYNDIAYKGLSQYYPAIAQYFFAKIAALMGLQPINALSLGAMFLPSISMVIGYLIWQKEFPPIQAAILTIATVVITGGTLYVDWYKRVNLLILLPWWVHYISMDMDNERIGKCEIILMGAIGAVLFLGYYYWFFAIAIATLIIWGNYIWRNGLKQFLAAYKASLWIVLLVIVLTSFYTVPLLMDYMNYNSKSLATRWFTMAQLQLFPYNFKGYGLVLLAGAFCIAALAKRDKIIKVIEAVVAACLIWYFLGIVAFFFDAPLLQSRMHYFLNVALMTGIVVGFFHIKKIWPEKGRSILLYTIAIGCLMAADQIGGITESKTFDVVGKHSNYTRTEKLPDLAVDKDFIHQIKDAVILTDVGFLARLGLSYQFITAIYYSHPSCQYNDRIKFLTIISYSKNPTFIAWMLQYNRFNKIDYIWLSNGNLKVIDDRFPDIPCVQLITIELKKSALGQAVLPLSKWPQLAAPRYVPVDVYNNFSDLEKVLATWSVNKMIKDRSRVQWAVLSEAQSKLLNSPVKNYEEWFSQVVKFYVASGK